MVSKSISSAPTGGGPATLRRVHRAMALRELAREPGIARVDLANRLGLSSMAVGRIVRELEQAGLSGEVDAPVVVSGRGRPPTGLQLVADGAYVVGAVISAYTQEINLLNLRGESVGAAQVQVTDITDGPATVKQFCHAIRKLIKQSRIAPRLVTGAGFAVAASVDTTDQTVTGGGYLGWQAFDLSGMASQALALPITVNNIADALLRAEAFSGCARDSRAAVMIHSATTLGSSSLSNNQLVHGSQFLAGRLGHFPMRTSNLVCSCGGSDCLNCAASGWSILTRLKLVESAQYQADQIQNYSRLIRELVNNEPKMSAAQIRQLNRVARQAGANLAKGLRYLELTLDPDIIVLAGALASHDAYFNGVIAELKKSGSGADISERVIRGSITPEHASGVIALLDTTFSPSLDVDRLVKAESARSQRLS